MAKSLALEASTGVWHIRPNPATQVPSPHSFRKDGRLEEDDADKVLSDVQAYCSRYVNGHMVQHHEESDHNMVLSYSDLSVWCYPCNAYVSNAVLQPAKEDAYLKKFGTLDYV
ncbi:histone deacetylase 6 [Ixodes scapularis]